MKYINDTTYKNLITQTKHINWAIYLPAKPGANETSANSSLLNSAVSMLKQTLKTDGTPSKESQIIINNIRQKSKHLTTPLKGQSVLVIIYKDYKVDYFDLPFIVETGFISDSPQLVLEPIDKYFAQNQSYYFLELHQNGCQLYEWDINGRKSINDTELQKGLIDALMIDEAALRSIQTKYLSSMNDGLAEGVHGQGGYKDKQKAYIKEYLHFIDKQLSKYSKTAIKPIVLVGSRQLGYAFKKISHNKRQIKGYMANLPAKFDLSVINNQLVKY